MTLFDRLFDRTVTGLGKAMDLTWQRNQAITSNVANAETPGYRAVDLDFSGELDKAFGRSNAPIKTTNAAHMDIGEGGQSRMIEDHTSPTKADGNNVDIDLQMGLLAYNSGKYSIAANLMRKHLSILKNAIREGKG
jgi:flagellar basal-body rod protein FlgB